MSFNTGIADVLHQSTDNFSSIIASAEALHSSEESFNKSLRNVLDLFIRTGNVLKDTVTRWNKSLKRSELEKYTNDHMLIIKAIDKLSYIDVKDEKVDVPFGMQGKYKDAVATLFNILKDLDARALVNITYDKFKQIRTEALNKIDISPRVTDLQETLSVKEQFLTDSIAAVNKIFTNSSRGEVKFSNVFDSMAEFTSARYQCVEAEKYLQDADELSKKAGDLSALVTDVTALTDVEISKEQSDSLADSAIIVAKVLDLYGTCALNLMSVSHNFTLVCNELYKKVR